MTPTQSNPTCPIQVPAFHFFPGTNDMFMKDAHRAAAALQAQYHDSVAQDQWGA